MAKHIFYTDGACSKNGTVKSTGGYGIYIKQSWMENEVQLNRKGEAFNLLTNGQPYPVTNNRMEGMAIITVLHLIAEYAVHNNHISHNLIAHHLNTNFLHNIQLKDSYTDGELAINTRSTASKQEQFILITDSKFWIQVMTLWLPSWSRNNLIYTKKNPDMLLALLYYLTLLKHNGINLEIIHVRSHQKGKRTAHADANDIADNLATSACNNNTTNYYTH